MSNFTPAVTADWLADKKNKFFEYDISSEALTMINRSETLKADMRAYAASDVTAAGKVNPKAGAGEYNTPVGKIKGFLYVAADRLSTPEGTVSILAHELGHFRVEEPDAPIATARANALTGKDKAAYESACHLTEGYAHYNEVKVRDEILETNRLAAELEQRPLTEQEVQLESRWRGEGVYGSRGEGQDHNVNRRLHISCLSRNDTASVLVHARLRKWNGARLPIPRTPTGSCGRNPSSGASSSPRLRRLRSRFRPTIHSSC